MSRPDAAFVLGGGGHRGSYEVGMLKALAEGGIRPDIILGTSIGAINGAIFAMHPDVAGAASMEELWRELSFSDIFPGSVWGRVWSAVQQRTYVHANEPLRDWLDGILGTSRFEDLATPFRCVAARIEDSAECWFSSGPLIDALLASSAVPGLLPPVEIDGKHYIDGGVVNSIPLSGALELGAKTIYVLHVGHIRDELEVPEKPWDVGVVAFEIARRHRFARDLASVSDATTVHILPTGAEPGRFNDPAKLRYTDLSMAQANIDAAYRATLDYLGRISS